MSFIVNKIHICFTLTGTYLEIDDDEWLIPEFHDKRDDFNLPTANFQFACSNILETSPYGVYLVYVSINTLCLQFLDRAN